MLIKMKSTHKTYKTQTPAFSKGNSCFFQPKLSINHPNDVYEQEADAVADKVMRMPDPSINSNAFFKPAVTHIQRKCAHCEEEEKKMQRKQAVTHVQREDKTPVGTTTPGAPDFTLSPPSFLQPTDQPDYLSMRQPFINRNIFHLWDPGSALQVWQYNFDFFRRFGLTPGLATTLTNLTAPRFIDSQLKANNPTWWEITDRELNTSTLDLSVPLLQFNADFSPVAPTWWQSIFGGGNKVQRKCAHCEAEEKKMHRKESGDEREEVAAGTENYINTLSGGKPLTQNERSFFEPRFGHDFSNVQLHTDTAANESAKNINALAYTHGNNIVFGPDQYQPDSDAGKKLLAHELTHVVQQNGNIQPYRDPKSFNFGKNDTATLIESSFNKAKDKETKPWIELITVELGTKTKDVNGVETWTGKGTVKYYDNAVKLAGFSFNATAGSETLGMTTKGTYTVTRIEGIGYNSGKYSGTYDKANREGPNNRYSKDLSANMSYAVFFHGGEALHAGPLDWSSHGCVHVDWDSMEVIQQINYHSVIGLTKVQIKYP